ncbi:MAG: hypothetical protein WB919_14950 [Candidatus Sulfotelmatobacter sp.]
MAHRLYSLVSACVLVGLTLSTSAFAASKAEHTSIGHTISIGPNEETSDVTCIGCSIFIRGHVLGDATAVGGSISIEDQGQIDGDVTGVAGNVRLDKEVKVMGDVTVVGGEIRRSPESAIQGDVTAMGGRGWVVPLMLAPFVILGLLVGFVIWLVQRLQRPTAPAVPA